MIHDDVRQQGHERGVVVQRRRANQVQSNLSSDALGFDVNVENPKIPQIEQSDKDLARLALEQAVKDNGETWNAGYVYVAGSAPLDRRNETWIDVKKKYAGIKEVAMQRFGLTYGPRYKRRWYLGE